MMKVVVNIWNIRIILKSKKSSALIMGLLPRLLPVCSLTGVIRCTILFGVVWLTDVVSSLGIVGVESLDFTILVVVFFSTRL